MTTGYSCISAVLIKGDQQSSGERFTQDTVNLPTKGSEVNTRDNAEIALPLGKELIFVAGIEVPVQDTGNALQFSEFCAVFREVLNLKKGQANHVLRDVFHGRSGRRAKFSETVKFFIDLLSTIKNDNQGKISSESSLSAKTWFDALKECLSKSRGVLATHGLDGFFELANFEILDASQKLILLNVLCDEVLVTEKVRNWIKEQDEEFTACVKEVGQKLKAAKNEESILKTQLRNDIIAGIEAKNGAPLSVEEHAAIVSRVKPAIEIAHAKVLQTKDHIMNYNQYPDAVRAESIFIDQDHVYWKLNISGKANVLCQKCRKADNTDTLDEKWSSIDTEEKGVIEKRAHFSRVKRKAEEQAHKKEMKEHKRRKEADSVGLPTVVEDLKEAAQR